LVLDVKVGNGAFMQSLDEAFKLAQAMVDTGKTFNVKTEALISDMNQPLGRFAGNSLEVYEILRIMRGEADEMMRDTVDLSISLVAKMLVLTGVCNNFNTALKTSIESLENGSALEKFKRNLELQGGNPAICDDPELILDKKVLKLPVNAEKSGFISEINTRSLGEAIVMMGGGRAKPEDKIDHAVGIEFLRKIGDEVRHGEEICIIHCRDISQAEIISQRVKAAYKIESEKILKPHLIHGFVN
jgi:pyrimidine-nucleoside phosphorylase